MTEPKNPYNLSNSPIIYHIKKRRLEKEFSQKVPRTKSKLTESLYDLSSLHKELRKRKIQRKQYVHDKLKT